MFHVVTAAETGMSDMGKVEEAVDPSRFRVAYRGAKARCRKETKHVVESYRKWLAKAHISVRNALNLSGGGWFDKLDPYAIVRPLPESLHRSLDHSLSVY